MTTPLLPASILSARPVALDAPGRAKDLFVRVSAPSLGQQLPLIVFSHGFGKSMDSYAPLVDAWTAAGFVVAQPTHLDSRSHGLAPDDPRTPSIWRTRVEDLKRVLDQFETLEASVPGVAGRIDRERIAVAGHSWGAQSASMLAGARVTGEDQSERDPRVKAAVLLALTGTGGADLSPFAAENFSFMSPDFAELTTPSLVVAGDHDQSLLSVRGPDWFTDGYRLAPGATDLLTLFGGEHSLGGIQGYLSTETTDEDPDRVALVQEATVAYLETALAVDPQAWSDLRLSLVQRNNPQGRIESK